MAKAIMVQGTMSNSGKTFVTAGPVSYTHLDVYKRQVMPLMIVAGDHARNDLAGAEADSWDSILKADGFETEVIMKGLGEIDAIAEMFVKHLKKAESL